MPFTISESRKSSSLEVKAATETMCDLQPRTDVHDAGGSSSIEVDVPCGGQGNEPGASDRGQQRTTREMVGPSRILPTAGGEDDGAPVESLVNLLLGPRDTSSPYFTQEFVRVPASSIPVIVDILSRPTDQASNTLESNHIRVLKDVDPQAFRMYQAWLDTGAIPWNDHSTQSHEAAPGDINTWRACWLLLNAHILGYKIGTFDFSDRIIDVLRTVVDNGVWADSDTINHIFRENSKDILDVLQLFVVDQCLKAGYRGISFQQTTSPPPSFTRLMLDRALVGLGNRASTHQDGICMTSDKALDIQFDIEDTVENRLRWATEAWAGSNRPQDRTNVPQLSTSTTQTAVSKGKEPASPRSFLGSLGTTQIAGSIEDVLYKSLKDRTSSPSMLAMTRDKALDIHFDTTDIAENRLRWATARATQPSMPAMTRNEALDVYFDTENTAENRLSWTAAAATHPSTPATSRDDALDIQSILRTRPKTDCAGRRERRPNLQCPQRLETRL